MAVVMSRRPRTWRFSGVLVLLCMIVAGLAPGAMAATFSHTYAFPKPEVRTLADGTALVELPGTEQDEGVAGAPILPMLTSRLYVPADLDVDRVEVSFGPMHALAGTYRLAHGVTPRPVSDPAPPPPEPADPAIYGSDAPYPAVVWRLASEQTLHGYRLVFTDVCPVRYLPASGQVDYAESVTVTVYASPARTVVPGRLRPRGIGQDEKDVRDLIDNDEALDVSSEANTDTPTAEDRQYLLITTAALQASFGPLLQHRASSAGGGFTVYSTTVEAIAATQAGRDLPEKIRTFIKNNYTTHGTRYVVLGGDADGPQAEQAVPTRGCPGTCGSYSDTYIPTDYYYACLDGTWDNNGNDIFGESTDGVGGFDIDWLAEVAVGRIPADTTDEVQRAITKIIAYETSPTPFRTLMVGEKLDTTPTWGGDRMDYVYQAMTAMPRETLYDRDKPSQPWSSPALIALLSSDRFGLISHLGHSNSQSVMRLSINALSTITNASPFVAYSQGCYSSSFDNRDSLGNYAAEDSMGENFLVATTSDACAYLGNSRYGWYNPGSVVNGSGNLVHRKFIEAIFQSGIRRLGLANNRSKEGLTYSQGWFRWLGMAVNLMGDPATPLDLAATATDILVAIAAPTDGFAVERTQETHFLARVMTGLGAPLTGATVKATFSSGDPAVTLYDDGAHQDEAAGDGLYGGTWTAGAVANVAVTVTATKTGYTAGSNTVHGTVDRLNDYTLETDSGYILGTGTAATVLTTDADDESFPIEIGFPFTFYDRTFTSLYVSTNGTISFTTPGPYPSNAKIPNTAQPNYLIAAYWDDLRVDPAVNGSIEYLQFGSAPYRMLFITWKKMLHHDETNTKNTFSFQVHLYESGNKIEIGYYFDTWSSTDYSNGRSATVGIEKGDVGLQYSYNSFIKAYSLGLTFTPRPRAAFPIAPLQMLLLP